jgi:hypothetical protein
MPSVLLVVILIWAGLSGARGTEAEAVNEDVPKPPPGFSPGNITTQKSSSAKTPAGAGNGGAQSSTPSGGVTNGAGKPAGSGAPAVARLYGFSVPRRHKERPIGLETPTNGCFGNLMGCRHVGAAEGDQYDLHHVRPSSHLERRTYWERRCAWPRCFVRLFQAARRSHADYRPPSCVRRSRQRTLLAVEKARSPCSGLFV